MANTYTLISSATVGSGGASSIDFTSIPSTYTDLLLKVSTRSDQSSIGYTAFRFNSSSANYSQKFLQGDGSTTTSYGGVSNMLYVLSGSTTNTNVWDNTDIYITNYAGSNYKSLFIDNVVDNGTTSNSFCVLSGGLWSDTSVISSITLYAANSSLSFNKTFQQYSTAYLYGIKNS